MEPKYDRLDEFFRKQLSDTTPDASWNVPDDSIFENAISQVPVPSGKKKRRFVLFFLGLGVLMVFMIHEYTSAHKFDQLKLYTTKLEQIIQKSKENSPAGSFIYSAQNSNDPEKTDLSKASTIDAIQKMPSNPQIKASKIVTSNQSGMVMSKDGFNASSPRSYSGFQSVPFTTHLQDEDALIRDNATLAQQLQVQHRQLSLTDKLPAIPSSINVTERIIPALNIVPDLAICHAEKNNVHTWSVGLLGNVNSSWLTMSHVPVTMEKQLTKYDHAQTSSGIQAFVLKNLSDRWSLSFGLGYNQYKSKSEFVNTLYYDENNEIITVSGDHIYNADLEMTNPLGAHRSRTNIILDQSMHQNDLITENMFIRQTFTVASIDLGMDYRLVRDKKFGLYTGAGIAYNVNMALKNEFDVTLSANGFNHHYQEVVNTLGGFRKTFASAYFKLAGEYQLHDRWSLFIETKFGQSIGSLRDSRPASGPRTFLNDLHLSIGAAYHF
ncbi:MAG: hypothetical protein ABIQ02_05775 [Saprospiraceae bacterium]